MMNKIINEHVMYHVSSGSVLFSVKYNIDRNESSSHKCAALLMPFPKLSTVGNITPIQKQNYFTRFALFYSLTYI